MASIGRIDWTEPIITQLNTTVQAYLPAELLTVAAAKRPPVVQNWYTASVPMVAALDRLPAVTITDEPPGGVEMGFLGTGTPSGVMPTVEGRYTIYVVYVMGYKGTERAMSQSREARAAIMAVLAKYARSDATVGWKMGLPRTGQSGTGAVDRVRAPEGTYIYASVKFTCMVDAGAPLD